MSESVPFIDFGGDGPLLHFAHANAYPPRSYRRFLQQLSRRYHVVAIEQRPVWPGSQPEEMESWDMFAADLVRLFEQQGWREVLAVGHSLGAVTTAAAAVARPHLFRALALIEPVFLPPPVLEMAARYPERAFDLPLVQIARQRRDRWPDRQTAFDHFRARSVFGRWSDDALWDFVDGGLQVDEDGQITLGFPRSWEARIYSQPPLKVWELPPRIKQPTLAVRGSDTDTLLQPAWELWQQLQPQATFVEVTNAGHLLTMERPEMVAQHVLDFLNTQLGLD